MCAFTILSWNVETFGETKLGAIDNYVAAVVTGSNADLVFFLEGTTKAQTELSRRIGGLLADVTGGSWFAFGSDPTGKARPLPPTIRPAEWPKKAEIDSYRADLLRCYNEVKPKDFVLKSPLVPGQVWQTREALERAGLLRRDVETYSAFFRYDPAIWNDGQGALVALGSWVSLSKAQPGSLVSWDSQGTDIGYANPTSVFNGRSPYIANTYFALPANPVQVAAFFPIACFHAPFGESGDLDMRVKANVGMMRLGTPAPGGTLDIAAQQQSTVCGDFNVSFNASEPLGGLTNPIPSTKSKSAQNYGAYYATGYRMQIAAPTSLKAVNEDLRPKTDPLDFRSSAYDNVMVKAGTGSPITGAVGSVMDLIDDTYKRTTSPGNYLSQLTGIPTTKKMFDAFFYVRKTVSDHLPVKCTLTVPART